MQTPRPKRTLSVAPMLDWTDRHFRYLARQISRHAWLYTEMINAGAIIHGDPARFLEYNDCEHPIALQLGGSDPAQLAQAAKKVAQYQPQLRLPQPARTKRRVWRVFDERSRAGC